MSPTLLKTMAKTYSIYGFYRCSLTTETIILEEDPHLEEDHRLEVLAAVISEEAEPQEAGKR